MAVTKASNLRQQEWHCLFMQGQKLRTYMTFPVPVEPEGMTAAQWTEYKKSKLKLKLQFSPEQCNDFALFELMRMKPELSESITNYAVWLRKAADKCDFTN